MSDPLYDDLYKDQKAGKEIFNKIKQQRVYNAILEREDRKWRENLYPSGMSWNMCMANHVYDHLSKGGYVETDPEKLEMMALGTARHTEWQDVLLDTKGYLVKPKFPKVVLDEIERKKAAGEKVRDFPEVYVYCPYWFISGYLDLPYILRKVMKLADFKTKNLDIDEWELIKKAESKELTLPLPKDLCQLYIYKVVTEKYDYWDGKTVDELRLAYYNNPTFKHPKFDPEWEYFESPDPVKVQMTIDLLDEGRNQMLRYLAGEPKLCEYKHCTARSH